MLLMHSLNLLLLPLWACLLLVSCGDMPHNKEEAKRVEVKQLPQTRQEITLSFAPVVKKVAPAVVNIYAIHQETPELPHSSFMADPFFKQFFERFYQREEAGRESDALGSGVIVSQDGLILTNYHLIKDADIIRVALTDKREFTAKVVVMDKRTDLVLLQIDGKGDFPFLPLSPQGDLEVGDLVLAIGNPFGVGQTVTTGIISALARSQKGINDFRTFIQTDAAINPGNSGGPLVTTDGRLVGINTAIYSKSGGNMGIGFAIPTALALPVLESAKKGGRVVRPWIGLEVESVTATKAQDLGLPYPYGVLVKSVYSQGPADKAGIKVGDFIGALNDDEIEDDAALDYYVAVAPMREKTEVTLFRKGKKIKLSLILAEPLSAEKPEPLLIKGHNPLQGLKIRTLSPALALDLGLNPMKEGVVITEIMDTAPSLRLGFQPGDVIEAINKRKVKTKEDVAESLRRKTLSWDLILRRGNKVVSLQVAGK